MFDLNKLNAFMNADFEEKVKKEEKKEGYKLTSIDDVNWRLAQIKENQEKIEEIKSHIKEEKEKYIAKLEQYEKQEVTPLEQANEWHMQLLQQFYDENCQFDKNGKPEVLSVINGKIGYRKQQDKYDYDEALIVTELEKAGIQNYIKKSINKADLKKAIVKDEQGNAMLGDIKLEGITITKQDSVFKVYFNKK